MDALTTVLGIRLARSSVRNVFYRMVLRVLLFVTMKQIGVGKSCVTGTGLLVCCRLGACGLGILTAVISSAHCMWSWIGMRGADAVERLVLRGLVC